MNRPRVNKIFYLQTFTSGYTIFNLPHLVARTRCIERIRAGIHLDSLQVKNLVNMWPIHKHSLPSLLLRLVWTPACIDRYVIGTCRYMYMNVIMC